ncbi:hypothetical protein B2J93_823 [Marssonina coronariae]|uniref:ribonuclease H n=1 Tax=Diplocarpon coronariae TaxID=2795749 RepID=A0A218ZEK6_9HELO|nr:hypothetical protein B2J93_823 [Marssonina coronariae]
MSLPRPPKQLVHTLPNGKAVCFDHYLRRCDVCTVDFSFGESDEDEPGNYSFYRSNATEYSSHEHVEKEENEKDDRVFILSGSTARFMPQWDEQIFGPSQARRYMQNYHNPPKALALSSLETQYCSICQLTWLVGEEGEAAAKAHPFHHTYFNKYSGTRRSLLVFTDGACSNNGYQGARGGIGLFFGPGSKLNRSEEILVPGRLTNQRAELEAAVRALDVVRNIAIPYRHRYLVECMCQHIDTWALNMDGALVNRQGKLIENSQTFLRLQDEVEKLSMVGVQVAYYHVGREENKEADHLAKASIAGGRP